MSSFSGGELKDDFGLADEAQVIAGDAFDGGWVIAEAGDFAAEGFDFPAEDGRIFFDFGELAFEPAESWETFRREDEDGDADEGDGENEEGQKSFDDADKAVHAATMQ